jgi:hypothetical protein
MDLVVYFEYTNTQPVSMLLFFSLERRCSSWCSLLTGSNIDFRTCDAEARTSMNEGSQICCRAFLSLWIGNYNYCTRHMSHGLVLSACQNKVHYFKET